MQQQRQLRLGDILDDYCPRERRVTNHAVVAMIGTDVKQTRCTTCECEHVYKHAKVPRQRRKAETPAALYSQVLAGKPKRVAHETPANSTEPVDTEVDAVVDEAPAVAEAPPQAARTADVVEIASGNGNNAHTETPIAAAPSRDDADATEPSDDEGPVHRPLIRASLPRPEGQPTPTRPMPEFTIRQPGGRPSRFRPRNARGAQPFNANRSNGNVAGPPRGMRPGGSRPPQGAGAPRAARRHGQGGGGRKRSK